MYHVVLSVSHPCPRCQLCLFSRFIFLTHQSQHTYSSFFIAFIHPVNFGTWQWIRTWRKEPLLLEQRSYGLYPHDDVINPRPHHQHPPDTAVWLCLKLWPQASLLSFAVLFSSEWLSLVFLDNKVKIEIRIIKESDLWNFSSKTKLNLIYGIFVLKTNLKSRMRSLKRIFIHLYIAICQEIWKIIHETVPNKIME